MSLACAANPRVDPSADPCNWLGYIPSNALTTVSLELYVHVAFLQTLCLWKWGGRYMLPMMIAAYITTLGLSLRYVLNNNPDLKAVYLVEDLLVVLAPCGFIATNYMLIGRLATALQAGSHLIISPRRITRLFLLSDFVTLGIQGVGGPLIANQTPVVVEVGIRIDQVGLILQAVSFMFFTFVFVRFLWSLRRHDRAIWSRDSGQPWTRHWHSLAFAIGINCVCITLRCIYRTVEISTGSRGPLSTNEHFFYGLDSLPLWISITAYVIVWPGRYISKDGTHMVRDQEPKPIPLENLEGTRG